MVGVLHLKSRKRNTKMRQSTLLAVAGVGILATATALTAFADEQNFSFSDFDSVEASAGVDVVLRQGDYSVRAEGSEKALERLKVEKRGRTLHIGRRNTTFSWGTTGPVTVTVSAPNYAGLSASSGSDVSGSGLRLTDVSVSVSSGADMELAGSCEELTVSVSSGSDFDGEDLHCQNVTASASSGADANVWAARSLVGSASSGGDIDVYGEPESITKNTSSGGSVRPS